jgi:anti-sigma regulatory factor (Ser/Thr protein kinase)
VVDPFRSRTARVADEHLRPLPGTDAALALGMMRAVLDAGLQDEGWCRAYTTGYDALLERLEEYPVERCASLCGVPADAIERVARQFASAQPSLLRLGVGAQRHRGAPVAYRTIACLPAITGAWRDLGGGLASMTGPYIRAATRMDRLAPPPPPTRTVNMMEIGRALTEVWLDRLSQVAGACGFKRTRLWLVSPEGFTAEASELLHAREAFGSSRRQLELLTARLSPEAAAAADQAAEPPDEFEMVIPMGGDTELIAANTVEQIARRHQFSPDDITKIKHALVEACINASEHSLSPDRKIYQRFRVESDKLVVTVSSRGVSLPPPATAQGQNSNGGDPSDETKGRRGWGLKLIRTLMDEVEFERVDDGTSLRMTKYLRR